MKILKYTQKYNLLIIFQTEQEFGGLDILVSNAATNPTQSTFFETSEEVWDKIFDTNVKSTFLLLQEALPLLRKSKSASIILISSIAAYTPFTVSIFKKSCILSYLIYSMFM